MEVREVPAGVAVEARSEHMRALCEQILRSGASDAGGGAGDENPPAREPHGSFPRAPAWLRACAAATARRTLSSPALVTAELVDDAAVGDDEAAIAEPDQLFEFRGDDRERHAFVGQFGHQAVNLGAFPGIDALGRRVEQQDAWRPHQVAREPQLLLVAARQVGHRTLRRGRLDVEGAQGGANGAAVAADDAAE